MNDELSGATIVYYNLTDVFTVDGQKATPNAPAAGSRVRAVLAPKESAAGSAPVPAATGPVLRPSTALEGGSSGGAGTGAGTKP